jgi:hypothetical protein
MIIENILDVNNNIIGTLTFPDDTNQSVINAALALYTVSSPITIKVPVVPTINITQTGQVTTSASTPTTIGGMTCLPPAGMYVVQFNGSVNTNGSSASGTFGIYVSGVLVTETNRPISCNLSLLGGLVSISVNAIGIGTCSGSEISLDGNSTLDVRFASTNGGTIGFNERVLTLLKVG